jgi:3-deoxy-D-manno-octulosonate 8-phosphate phosphatase (KDO 8-P phosphatase)
MNANSALSTQHSALFRAIELLVLDVDGVLTDGRVVYGDNGVELKAFDIRDGAGIKAWQMVGHQVALISGRSSPVVERRAVELGIRHLHQGVQDKRAAYRQILEHGNWKPAQVCCMGDDLPDLPLLSDCGLAVAVADACIDVRTAAHVVTRAPGGRGAVREVIELILRSQGHWQRVLSVVRGS